VSMSCWGGVWAWVWGSYIGIKMAISAYQSKIRVIRPHYAHIARQPGCLPALE
jgi:hypothetical protein